MKRKASFISAIKLLLIYEKSEKNFDTYGVYISVNDLFTDKPRRSYHLDAFTLSTANKFGKYSILCWDDY